MFSLILLFDRSYKCEQQKQKIKSQTCWVVGRNSIPSKAARFLGKPPWKSHGDFQGILAAFESGGDWFINLGCFFCEGFFTKCTYTLFARHFDVLSFCSKVIVLRTCQMLCLLHVIGYQQVRPHQKTFTKKNYMWVIFRVATFFCDCFFYFVHFFVYYFVEFGKGIITIWVSIVIYMCSARAREIPIPGPLPTNKTKPTLRIAILYMKQHVKHEKKCMNSFCSLWFCNFCFLSSWVGCVR